MIEAERERAVDRQRAAEAHAAEHLEFAPALQQQPDELQEILVPAHRDAVFGDAAEARHHARVQILAQLGDVADRPERHARARRLHAGNAGGQRLDLQPVDRHHGVAVVHQMMRQREARRPQPDHQHLASGRGPRQRTVDVERIPARQQRVDLEAARQRQHVLEHAGLDLRNVDRLLLLIDAGLHAVVADAVAGGGAHRIVDDDDGERAEGVALGLGEIHLGDLLVERTAGERDAERALLELAGLLAQPLRAAVLALVVAPDAVVGVIERAGEIGAGIGQREAVAGAAVRLGQLEHRHAVDRFGLDRHEMERIDLVRHLEQHAALVGALAFRRMGRPGGIACGGVERGGVFGLGLHPAIDMFGEAQFGELAADQRFDLAAQRAVGVERRGLVGRIFLGGAALHEQPLDGVERRQRVVTAAQLGKLARDAEQFADEVLELGREREDQFRLGLAGERVRRRARGKQAAVKFRVARFQERQEAPVETHQFFPVVEGRELEAEAKGRRRKHRRRSPKSTEQAASGAAHKPT